MKNLFILIFILTGFHLVQAQEKFIIRVEKPSKSDFKEFYTNNYDIASYSPGLYIDLVVNKEQSDNLLQLGYNFSVIQTEQQIKENFVVGKSLNGYRTHDELLTELQQIEADNPGICKLYDIGDSRGKEYLNGGNSNYVNYNHEIWALKLSDNVNIEEDEPYVYYMGEHHAREPISLEVSMYILNYLVTNYGTDPDVTDWVNNTQIWFMPLVNPNGHKIVTDEDDLWWRKNIRDNNENGQLDFGSTPDGVDPNRNYGWHWGGTGSSGDPYSDTYRGPSAFSEPCIQAMKNMIDTYHFVTGITYHSYSELVLFPYGYDNGVTAPDHDALEELAVEMAVTIPAAGGGHYTPQESWQLYPASGTTDDYSYGERGIFSFTVELGTEFIPPASQIDGICQDNLQAALILLDRVNHSTLTGIIRDASTNQPVVAEVYIDGIDNTGEFREPYESDTDFGRYYRLLMDGNYSVTYSAYGYIPQTFNSVSINSSGQTILDVYLAQAQTVTVTGTVTDFDTGLPIENATIEVLDTPLPPVTTNQDGEYTIENIMEGTYSFRVYAADYATIMQELSVSVSSTVFDFQLQESFAWSFESGSFEPEWSFGGNAPWFITTENPYDGAYCTKSGAIGNYQSSEMEITLELTSGGDISFARKVSSEADYDYLEFYIDDIKQGEWAGEVAWAEVTYPVTAGEHTFKWVYDKDQSVSNGSDCGWIDYIIFPPFAGPPDIDVNPLSFEVTLNVDESSVELLELSNLGEQDLNYNISKQYIISKSKSFCTASGGCDEYISRVIFNTIDNTSTCSNYADYTSISTNVNVGETYSLT
ncbi:MAG: carboxypeptidase regulatory-like domain-containing protein, partial [Bacteroidales bacterium]|nr:carboxypeptidase regulatory-like domain-containing protein [Bacteroidales bacterium]